MCSKTVQAKEPKEPKKTGFTDTMLSELGNKMLLHTDVHLLYSRLTYRSRPKLLSKFKQNFYPSMFACIKGY